MSRGACEAAGKGLCTPGAAPCRRDGTDYPPIPIDQAAAQLNLPITVVAGDGTAKPTQTQAKEEGGNVFATGDDGKKHLVCELQQLTGGELTQCINEDGFKIDPAAGGGWCYSQVPAIVGEQCKKLGAPGTVRFFGGSEPRNGSEVFTYCITGK